MPKRRTRIQGNRIRNYHKAIMQKMFGRIKNWFNRNSKDSTMEIEHGGCNRGTDINIKRFTQRLWDANEKLRRMAGVLRKRPRKEEGEGVSAKEARAKERALRLKKIYEDEDFKEVIDALTEIENISYFSIKHPETKRDAISLDYYYGYMNGRISVVDHFRDMFHKAILHLQKLSMKENENKS